MSSKWVRVLRKNKHVLVRVGRDEDKPPIYSHTLENGDKKMTSSFGFNASYEPVAPININDSVLSRSSIAVTKPDSDGLLLLTEGNYELIRHDSNSDMVNKRITRVKRLAGLFNQEKGDVT